MKTLIRRSALAALLALMLAALALPAMPALAALAESAETQAPAVKPTSVKLSASATLKLAIGDTLTLTPTLKPENASTTYSWKTSNRRVATVSGGVVTGKKAGTATITVTTANKKKSTVKIKVYDPYLPTSVKLDRTGTVKLPLGETLTLTPTLSPATAQSGFTWKTSSKKIATVSGGVVTGKKVGTATITVVTRNNKKAKMKVRVYDPYLPASVSLNASGTQSLLVTQVIKLEATLAPETAQSALKWKSSNKKIAYVNAQGEVMGVAPGTATITVTTRNSKKAKVKIRVTDDGKQPIVPPAGYDLPYVIYACKNSHTIAIIARDDNGEWTRVIRLFPTGMGRKNVTDVGFFTLAKKERWHKWGSGYSPYANKLSVGIYLHGPIYKSKNQNTIRPNYYNCIGTDCSSGCLRTVCGCAAWVYYNCPVGTYVVVAQNSRYSTPRPAKIKSNATKDPTDPGSNPEVLITRFSVEPGELMLATGETQAVSPVNPYPANTSTTGYSFASSDTAVATVNASGAVTGVAPGTAVITVTAADDFKCRVTVPVTVTGDMAEADKAVDEVVTDIPDDIALEADAPVEEEAIEAPVEETPDDAEAPAEDVPAAEAPAEEAPEDDSGLTMEAEALPELPGEIIVEGE